MANKDCLVCTSTEELEIWTRKAKDGDVDAMFTIGTWLRFGLGVPVDQETSFFWLTKAAQNGNVAALGALYYYGKGGKQVDYKKAFECWTQAVDHGNIPSLHSLAYLYMHAQGVEKDELKARELLEKAAAVEFPPAMGNLAMMYELGEGGVQVDERKAKGLFERAAQLGDCTAMANLGLIYEEGIGEERVGRDVAQAQQLYTKAASMGETFALVQLAEMFRWGATGVEPDLKKAFETLEQAVALGGKEAKFLLAMWHMEGEPNASQLVRAIELLGSIVSADPRAIDPLCALFESVIPCSREGSGFSTSDRVKLLTAYHLYHPQWTNILENPSVQEQINQCGSSSLLALLLSVGLCTNALGHTFLEQLHKVKPKLSYKISKSRHEEYMELVEKAKQIERDTYEMISRLGILGGRVPTPIPEDVLEVFEQNQAQLLQNEKRREQLKEQRMEDIPEEDAYILMEPLWQALEAATQCFHRMAEMKCAFLAGVLLGDPKETPLALLPTEIGLKILSHVTNLHHFFDRTCKEEKK